MCSPPPPPRSKFFPFRVDTISEEACCATKQTGSQKKLPPLWKWRNFYQVSPFTCGRFDLVILVSEGKRESLLTVHFTSSKIGSLRSSVFWLFWHAAPVLEALLTLPNISGRRGREEVTWLDTASTRSNFAKSNLLVQTMFVRKPYWSWLQKNQFDVFKWPLTFCRAEWIFSFQFCIVQSCLKWLNLWQK